MEEQNTRETIEISAEVAAIIKNVRKSLGCSMDDLLREAVTSYNKFILSRNRFHRLLEGSGQAAVRYRQSRNREHEQQETIEHEVAGADPFEGEVIVDSSSTHRKKAS